MLGLNSSSHGACCPARLVMPFKLSACSSLIHSDGNGVSDAATLFDASGVAAAMVADGQIGIYGGDNARTGQAQRQRPAVGVLQIPET